LSLALGAEFDPEEYKEAFDDHTKPKIGNRTFLTKKAAKGEN